MKVPREELSRKLQELDGIIERMLRDSRIPGAALAVVAGGQTVYSRGFGYRDLKARKPVTSATLYPIASTTKPMNATLLGMLVDDGLIEWDAPVQRYLPRFRLCDAAVTPRVTVRDLITMRTGLPRHDWVWMGRRTNRAQLADALQYLEPSADFRRRFQYSNLSVTTAGHVAEIVTGRPWETLVRERLFVPLGMRRTRCTRPTRGNITLSYHENARRQLLVNRHLVSAVTAPSGGAVYSTVADMARWVAFNLAGGRVARRRLIASRTLAEIHAPQVVIGNRSLTGLPPDGAYALGWLVHYYNGHRYLAHAGFVHDAYSSVMFFPEQGLGMVSFVNFGSPLPADLINQYAFDSVLGLSPAQTFEQRLAQYERKIVETRRRNESMPRIQDTRPSHPLRFYAGRYGHPGYGTIEIRRRGRMLELRLHQLRLRLSHWHYDVWVAEEEDRWPIHVPHAFDRHCPIQFHSSVQNGISALSIPLEPEVAPIRFNKKMRHDS